MFEHKLGFFRIIHMFNFPALECSKHLFFSGIILKNIDPGWGECGRGSRTARRSWSPTHRLWGPGTSASSGPGMGASPRSGGQAARICSGRSSRESSRGEDEPEITSHCHFLVDITCLDTFMRDTGPGPMGWQHLWTPQPATRDTSQWILQWSSTWQGRNISQQIEHQFPTKFTKKQCTSDDAFCDILFPNIVKLNRISISFWERKRTLTQSER